MTLTRRIALFIAATLLLALGGALLLQTLAARGAIEQQQDMRNRDAAAALAIALSQQQGDAAAMQAVATAQFDLGHYRRIALVGPDGQPRFDLTQTAAQPDVPRWFAQWLPLRVQPGQALVSSGWQEMGRLTVAAHSGWAHEALWAATSRTAGWTAALGALAMLLASWLLRAWQRPLAATVAQASALEQGRFVLADEPALPELRQLTRSMNATVHRLREMFAHQAQQVAWLQRRAQLDALTGLPNRAHLSLALDRRLRLQAGQGLPLLWVRLPELEVLNQEHGRDMADAVLRETAGVLLRQVQAEPDALAGRLSGTDFALCLPLAGMATELAPALYRSVREAVTNLLPGVPVAVAAIDGLSARDVQALLGEGDQALQRAAAQGGLWIAPSADALPGGSPSERGAAMGRAAAQLSAAQAGLASALAEGRARLGEYAVRDRQGQLIHLECPLRLQLEPGGDHLPAARWLPLARRGGRMGEVDRLALRRVLDACAQDGRPRAVNMALGSLAEPGLVDTVTGWLEADPAAAARLWVDWVDGGQLGDWRVAEQVIGRWRQLGVRMGVEHAGAAPEQLTRLRDLGLSYVKVDGLHLRGAATDPQVNDYARSLVGLIQLLGLQALAEGIDRPDDLAALWALGFDGATGVALREPPAQGIPPAGGAAARRAARAAPAPVA